MRMNRIVLLVIGILFASASQLACSSDGESTGTGGSGGSTGVGGAAGGSGGGAGGGGGAPLAYQALKPCEAESTYVTGTIVQFPDPSTGTFTYAPKCLKVTAGTTVTFSGSFDSHPMAKSTTRGDVTNSPITEKISGSSATFTFSTPGFYPYYCTYHGNGDGVSMAGVVWVQ